MTRAVPVLAAMLAACAPSPPTAPVDTTATADTAPTADTMGPPPAWMPPDTRGPYVVGATTLEIERADLPDLVVEVWYPARDDGSATVTPYEEGWVAFASGALRDAPVDPRGGPYPVAAFSHGFGGIRFQSVFLTEHLASHGWVVVAPDHAGSTLVDLDPGRSGEVAAVRPADVRHAVDALAGGPLPDLVVRTDTYAVVGHSFGAWTALAVAGGLVDGPGFEQVCAEGGRTGCNFFEDQVLPTDLLDRWGQPDPRARVAVALAPGLWYSFGPDGSGLADVRAPLVLAGTRDGDLPYDREARPTWDALGAPKWLGTLEDAGHWAFSDLCALVPVEDCTGADGGYMDPSRVQALTTSRVLAHLGQHLLGDDRYTPWLTGADDLTWETAP